MKRLFSILFALLVGMCVFAQTGNVCTSKNTFILNPFDGPLANPHKGFTFPIGGTWAFSQQWELSPTGEKNNKAWDVISYCSGYKRWDALNPAEGVYDWTDLDKLLDACEKHGLGYALRVLPFSSTKGLANNYAVQEDYDMTPKFIYDLGAKKSDVVLSDKGNLYNLVVPVWDDPIYLKAHKDFAAALAKKYDGDPRIEYIDIRTFGNWGEWHVAHMEGTQMPSVEVQKDMLSYYASIFHKTLLVLPSSGKGEVYEHALSLGITKRDDGFIGAPNRAKTLIPAYEAHLPTVAENHTTYEGLLNNDDITYLKWTLERWKSEIEIAHLTFYVLDQASDAGYRFYTDNKVHVDSMTKRLGYNFMIRDAELLTSVGPTATTNALNLSIVNNGLAPCFFDLYFVAEFVDSAGTVLSKFGETIYVPKGVFEDDMVRHMTFADTVYAGNLNLATQKNVSIALSIYESEDDYRKGKNPTVRFDHKGIMENKKLLLTPCPHKYGGWDTLRVATVAEPGLRKHGCTRGGCEAYEEEIIPILSSAALIEANVGKNAFVLYSEGSTIHVKNVKGKTVCLYNSTGALRRKMKAKMDEVQMTVQQKGVYFVVVDNMQDTVIVR